MNDLDDDDLTPKPVTKPPAFATDIIENAWKMVGMDVYRPSDDTFLLLRVRSNETISRRSSETHTHQNRPSSHFEIRYQSQV